MNYFNSLFKIVPFAFLLFCTSLNANSVEFIKSNYSSLNISKNDVPSHPVVGKRLTIRVYLEGPLVNSSNNISSQGRRMMRDDLRVSPFTGQNYIPVTDPYQSVVGAIDLSQKFHHVGDGLLPDYAEISDPATVFSVSGENAIVDWVFVEIRSANDNGVVVSTRSGLLQRDGDVVDLDGFSGLHFPDLTDNTFYVVVKHRNHLGVMSMLVDGNSVIDFTDPQTAVYDIGTSMGANLDFTGLARKINQYGIAVLWAGNFNADNLIKYDPPFDDHNVLIIETSAYGESGSYGRSAVGYYQADYDLNSKVKYDNPGDDRNMLYGQTLFYQLNSQFLLNFTYILEQVPTIK